MSDENTPNYADLFGHRVFQAELRRDQVENLAALRQRQSEAGYAVTYVILQSMVEEIGAINVDMSMRELRYKLHQILSAIEVLLEHPEWIKKREVQS